MEGCFCVGSHHLPKNCIEKNHMKEKPKPCRKICLFIIICADKLSGGLRLIITDCFTGTLLQAICSLEFVKITRVYYIILE